MNKVLISVVIPVYNVEQYLRQCLDSVCNQTLKDIEIICIDDGSTDNSGKILDEYAQKDNRIKVIHKNNEGAASARNFGLKKIKGHYVIFFDSDDYMSKNALEILYSDAIKTSADITICRSNKLIEETNKIIFNKTSIRNDLIEYKKLFVPKNYANYIFQFCVGWPWDKLYAKNFINKYKLKFQSLRHSNDTFFVLSSLFLANKISIIDNVLVTHRYRNKSLAHTREKAPECFYLALNELYNNLQKYNLYELYKKSFINYCLSFSLWHICTIDNIKAKKIMLNYTKILFEKIEINKFNSKYFYSKERYILTQMYLYNFYTIMIISFLKTKYKKFKLLIKSIIQKIL